MSADFHDTTIFGQKPHVLRYYPRSFAPYLLLYFQLIHFLAKRPPPPLWDLLGSSGAFFRSESQQCLLSQKIQGEVDSHLFLFARNDAPQNIRGN